MIKIKLSSVSIDDYEKALHFYTKIVGFVKKHDIPLGNGDRWITVVSPADKNGTELLLEPNAEYPAMKALKKRWLAMVFHLRHLKLMTFKQNMSA